MPSLRNCPVCGCGIEKATLFQEENINLKRISDFSFASRKDPEFMCHRLYRCKGCDLVYVSNPPEDEHLAQAYHEANYDSAEEANDAANSYLIAMKSVLASLREKNTVLEIGSGTGVLLELMKEQGFNHLVGIEPSSAAIAAAPIHRKAWLKEGIFLESNYQPNSFDLICCFMTMEHVPDPLETAQAAFRLLKPGGAFVTVTHNYQSLVNRILGKRSPIIDIEHMQLFSNQSILALFERAGFDKVSANPFFNRYSIAYWLRLTPLPKAIKKSLLKFLILAQLENQKLSCNVGNTIAVGYKLK